MGKDTVCCLNYKGKEVDGRELKLHRLNADKKLRKVTACLPSAIIRTDLFFTVLFTLCWT